MTTRPPAPDVGAWDLDPVAERVRYAHDFKQRFGAESGLEYDPTSWWRSRVHPDDLEPMRSALFDHIAGRSLDYRMQFRLRGANGGYRWVLSSGQAVERDRDGRALRVLGTLTDLSSLQDWALREAAGTLRARLGHDLRTPLNAVLGFSQLLQAQLGGADMAAQRRHLAQIEQAGWQLLDQIERALGERAPNDEAATKAASRMRPGPP